ncbi:hypothetical protein ABEV00_05120 [Paenibacillus thiaminolyticus]|uniref:hypothetical protein n=1 Tax=Paenibacillus thiaminolyticus TaxID=49283 RepID=UPI003D2A7F22
MGDNPARIEETKSILRRMISKEIAIHTGCHLLSGMYHRGAHWVWYDFAEYCSLLQDMPLPPEYPQWNESALSEKLEKLHSYEEPVLQLARQLLTELEEGTERFFL